MQDIVKQVEQILDTDQVYLVGGSVRDYILEKEPKDYDFTTELLPDEVEARVRAAGRKPYLIGKKFGTSGFKVFAYETWNYVEVTTFRKEEYLPNNRKPKVEFVTDLKEDLSRRDFTINAIAYNHNSFYDPFGGRLDVLAKKIKAVGNSKDRFKEDPLRMLRAARFAAQLDFAVDPNIIGTARKMSHTITTVSRERWVQELDKLLVADNFAVGLALLADTHLLKYILPELWTMHKFYPEEWAMTLISVASSVPEPDERWASLLNLVGMHFAKVVKNEKQTYPHHNLVGVELATGICARLKFSNSRTKIVLESVKKSTS